MPEGNEHDNEGTPNVEFDGQYDEERAKRKIAAMAADKAKLQERIAAFEKAQADAEEAQKSELQKALDTAARLQKALDERTAADERSKALNDALKAHGLSAEDAELLDGVPADKLDARAEALAKRLGKSKDTEEHIPGKPRARLTPGHKSAASGSSRVDANAIADRIHNRGY